MEDLEIQVLGPLKSHNLKALGDFIGSTFQPGQEISVDDCFEFWEARDISASARGQLLSSACGRGWLRWTGRVQRSRRKARRGAWVMTYKVVS
ncbi:hypothetical protein HMPREF9306_00208 [Propionimicrobium lymphophilum ACS-093-V-SCH5]|uniref:Uncharacterized protein n=1 Tax=Propionimicrobium lymphophilum ACS-093-V-SCH5 TaxID=883161 RepID=S2X1A5_9ACTN|nr:hypothetical protein [Propionimicrobium lymphophilum]EPD33794.1 hypothetical protein HMPREF9306_00208 [Propionimicrobium lymphophilum ACS-093-V-SCH5]